MIDAVEAASQILEKHWAEVETRDAEKKRHWALWWAGIDGVTKPANTINALNIDEKKVARLRAEENSRKIERELQFGGKIVSSHEVCPYCHTKLLNGICVNIDCPRPEEESHK